MPRGAAEDEPDEDRPASREIASVLDVAYLLEGSGRIVGNQLRVTVKLFDADADYQILAHDFDSPFSMDAVTRIQREIAEQVAAAVGERIVPASRMMSSPNTGISSFVEH